jgi:hypothetical protein
MILSDIIETSLSYLYSLFSHSYRLHTLQLLVVVQPFYLFYLITFMVYSVILCLFGEDNGDVYTPNEQTVCHGSSAQGGTCENGKMEEK